MREQNRRDGELKRRAEQAALAAALQIGLNLLSTPRGRRILLALIGICLLVSVSVWIYQQKYVRPLATGPTVRIATWNLHQFSPRPAIDLRRIAQIIQTNNFDLVAIQEVKREGEEVDALLNTLGPPWRGAIGPINDSKSHKGGNNERFAFIYNAEHVREVGPIQDLPDPRAQSFDRVPCEDVFQAGQVRFTLVTVHLDFTRRDHRREEMAALAAMASHLSPDGGDKDVIVLGDFNEEHQTPNLALFDQNGWERLIHDPTNLSSTEDFDNILIDPRTTREWAGRSGVVNYDQVYSYTDHHAATNAVSDHRPAWADFATLVPVK